MNSNKKKKTTVNSQEPDSILQECLKYCFLKNNSRPLWILLLLLLLIYPADDTLEQIAFLQRLMLLLALWVFVLH